MRWGYLISAILVAAVLSAIGVYLLTGILVYQTINIALGGSFVPVWVVWIIIIVLLVLTLAYALASRKPRKA